MISFFVKKFLNFFDYFQKKKIIKKLKIIQGNKEFQTVFDVGAHKGETIDFFLKHLEIKNIYSFEPSEESFKSLLNKAEVLKKKFINVSIFLENSAVGSVDKNIKLNLLNETSSSTLQNLNLNSKYFKKKEKYFGKLINKKIEIKKVNFKNYLEIKNIDRIDLLKIDTEGYEFEVLKGLDSSISKVYIILFEHHYDDMIIKNYTFQNIHKFLVNNGFKKVYKIKMPFRKSFDYIYIKNTVKTN